MAYGHDPYGAAIGQGSGGTRQFTVTKSDTVDLTDGTSTIVARAILVNDTGPVDVAFIAFGDTVAKTWKGLVAGTIIPMYVKRVMTTNTTATDMLALY
jgi:hypothetical protein